VSKEGKGKVLSSASKKVAPIPEPAKSDDEEDDVEDKDDKGIDEEGIARLMKALGDDDYSGCE